MQVAKNKVVSLTYELQVDDENGEKTLVEKVEKDQPLVFLFGAGSMLPEFEKNLDGKSAGDTFAFSIDPENGYGEFDEEAVVDLPKDIFKVDDKIEEGMLEVGNVIPMTDQQGHRLQGRVVEVMDDAVTMDFNHPLAGMDMHFAGQIVNVRSATLEEISHGHVHGEGGHQH